MRRIFALILAAVLLAGCAAGQPVHTDPAPMTGAEPVGEGGNLWYLPGEVLEDMEIRQLLGTGDGLLLCGSDRLKLLSWEDLTVSAERALEASDLVYVQVLDGSISIADPERKTVTLLGEDLAVTDTIPCDAGTKSWLVSPDAAKVFTFAGDGIGVRDLSTGADRELLRCRFLTVLAVNGERISLAAMGETDLMNHWYELDLRQVSLTELEGSSLIALQEALCPVSTGAYVRAGTGKAALYDAEGGHISSCAPTGKPGRDFVWSERWQGWFFLEYVDDGCRLCFWDPAVPTGGENVDIRPEEVPEGTILPQELYDRAEELSKRFDLDIRIADRAIRNYGSYDSEMLTDPEDAARALDILEAALAEYPEGFFTQLKYGNRHAVRVELVDTLAGKKGYDVSSGTSAFTVRLDRYCMIVLSAQRIRESAIFHEFSHIIDDRMAWEARLRPEAMYSEEGWLALQPEGFAYADSYQNIPEEVTWFYDSGYFASDYACVSATEDRAVTLEKAMIFAREVFDANPHLMPKLEYYCACIRDSFDTSGWPEVTRWERLLPKN